MPRSPHVRRALLAAATALAAFVAPAGVDPAGADPAPPPPPPSAISPGRLGGLGPCGLSSSTHVNPSWDAFPVTVFRPTGDGTPRSGGRCSRRTRPTVLLAHGYSGTNPAFYDELVDHLVSDGYVVVFAPYPSNVPVATSYATARAGFLAGVEGCGCADTADLGVVGHSFGAGMVPSLLQWAVGEGWGSRSLFGVSFAPWYAFEVGDGPIELPERTRLLVVNFDADTVNDARIGIELVQAAQLPADHVGHVLVRSDDHGEPDLVATHFVPNGSVERGSFTALGTYGVLRNVAAVADCARTGRSCDVPLSNMGFWGDDPSGVRVQRAIVSDDPRDRGPVARWECTNAFNPRPCAAPPGRAG